MLRPLLARDAVVCSDSGGKGSIALAAREMGVAHQAVNLIYGPSPGCKRFFPFLMDDRCCHISGLWVEDFTFRASMKFRAPSPDQQDGFESL